MWPSMWSPAIFGSRTSQGKRCSISLPSNFSSSRGSPALLDFAQVAVRVPGHVVSEEIAEPDVDKETAPALLKKLPDRTVRTAVELLLHTKVIDDSILDDQIFAGLEERIEEAHHAKARRVLVA